MDGSGNNGILDPAARSDFHPVPDDATGKPCPFPNPDAVTKASPVAELNPVSHVDVTGRQPVASYFSRTGNRHLARPGQ